MLRILIALLSMFLITINGVDGSEYNSYKGILYGFIIDYPTDWKIIENDVSYSFIKVSFEYLDEEYSPFVLVGIDELRERLTLDEYKTLILRQHVRGLSELTIIDEAPHRLADNEGLLINYRGIDNGVDVRGNIAYTIIDNTAYVIISAARYDEYNQLMQTFMHMIDSFKIDKSIIPKPISNVYSEEGIELMLPEGWHGLYSKSDEIMIRMAPSLASDARLHILIANITTLNTQLERLVDGCQIITQAIVDINDSMAVEIERVCDTTKSKILIFTTVNRIIIIEYSAIDDYYTYIDAIDDAINRSKVAADIDESIYSTLPRMISIEEIGYNITLPIDWRIFERHIDDTRIVYITPNGTNIVSNYTAIYLIDVVYDLNSLLSINKIQDGCNITRIHYIIYDKYTQGYESSCNDNLYIRGLHVANNTLIYLTTNDQRLYMNDFLAIVKGMDERLGYIESLQSSLQVEDIKIAEYGIKIAHSNTTIVEEIDIDETHKMLKIKVRTDRESIVKVEEDIFEGLKSIAVNEKIFDLTSDIHNLFIIVYNEDSDITLTAARIIPEFPIPMLVISLLLGMILLVRRMGYG